MARYRPWSSSFLLAGLLGLAACSQYWRDSGIYDLAGQRGLLLDVQDYYHRHAVEEGGRCPRPLMEAVTASQILADNAERLVVDLRYAYRDLLNDGDDDCDPKFRPLRCTIMRECRGYGERIFTMTKKQGGVEITDMSGARRR